MGILGAFGLTSWVRRNRKGLLSDRKLLKLVTEIQHKPSLWQQIFKRQAVIDYIIYVAEQLDPQRKNYTRFSPKKLKELATKLSQPNPDPIELKMTLNELVNHLTESLKYNIFHRPFRTATLTATGAAMLVNSVAGNPRPADAATQAYAGGLKQEYSQQQHQQNQNQQQHDINPNFQMPSDALLTQWMNQPVEETLRGTDYHPVNDQNYQAQVFGSDKPVMVLFYNNKSKDSAGLASLTATLHYQFPGIKLCTYKISDNKKNTQQDFNELKSKYPIKKTPSLLFYEKKNNKIKYNERISGGFQELSTFQKNHQILQKYINSTIL